MPISGKAFEGLRAAIEWNPTGGQALLSILKEHPTWMKYKDDPYGPLGLMLYGVLPSKQIADRISILIKSKPFPEDKLVACKVFGDGWKGRKITKRELAEVVAKILSELKET